jgi:hypothetical protein
MLDDADAQQIRRRRRRSSGTRVATAKSAYTAGRGWCGNRGNRRCRRRRTRRGRCRTGLRRRCDIQSPGDASRAMARLHVVVTTATPQVEKLRVLRVLEDPREEAFAQALAIATKKLERPASQVARRDRRLAIPGGRERALHELEGFVFR